MITATEVKDEFAALCSKSWDELCELCFEHEASRMLSDFERGAEELH